MNQYPQQYQHQPTAMWRCPFCGYYGEPIQGSSVSTGGVIVAIVFLFMCFPLFWIGLLMKDYHEFCPSCRVRLG